jgi:membrane associated rhomboid family serine protease
MNTELNPNEKVYQRPRVIHHNGASGAVYGLGLIGACVYFIGHATTFWLGVLGFLKGIVWPALMVFELLKYLNM